MNIKKLLVYALIALPSLLLQSCLKDDNELFDESPAARMEQYLDEAQQTLVDAPYGWILDYYPESSQAYGGFTYTVKFSPDSATVRFENRLSSGAETSLYSMKRNDGPVLSFDSFNSFLHYYATPNGDQVEGYNGDFEFVIDSIAEDVVKVHGTRNHNTLYFRRLSEPAADYMNKVGDMADLFQLSGADVTIGGQQGRLEFDKESRQIVFEVPGDTVQVAYTVTDKGLRLYKPVTIGGATISEIAYDDNAIAVSGDGVATTKGYVDPHIITDAIGGVGSDDEAFSRTFRGFKHLDQFTIQSNQSWLHVAVNPENGTITLSADANTTGAMRGATVYVVNGDYVSTFSVTQCELKDLLGSYLFQYSDYANAVQQVQATISAGKNNQVTFTFTPKALGIPVEFPGTFDQNSGAIMFPQLSLLGTGQNQAGTTFYFYNIYDLNGGGSYLFTPDIDMPMYFQYNSRYGTIAQFGADNLYYNGQFIGYKCHGVMIMGANVEVTSSNDFLGYFDIISNGLLVKLGASPAKPGNTFVPMRAPKPSKPFLPHITLK